ARATSAPAICSASATACLIASTVESMFTTTPRRSPREGALPTPITSIPPPGLGSPITAQIFVVPTSSPTTSSGAFTFFMGAGAPWPPRTAGGPFESRVASFVGASLQDHLVAEAEIHALHVLGRRHLGQHAFEAGQPLLPLLAAQPHLDAVDRVEHRALGPAHVDLRDLRGQARAGAEQRADERDGGAGPRPRFRPHGGQLVLAQTADDRHLGGHRVALLAEQAAVLVEPVQ